MTSEPLTKQDFKDGMKSFGKVVKAESKAGTIEAIQEHEQSCHERNKEIFVTEKNCAQRRTDCKDNVHTKMRSIEKPLVDDSNNTVSVKVKFPDHVKKNKVTYGVGLFAAIEFILAVTYIIIEKWPG